MKLIEIIPAYFTAHATTERCRQLVTALGKRDVVCRATPGFIVNRMARPYYLEGFRLLEEHVARAPQIDRALKAGGHFRMGPLELTDFIGQTSTIRSVGKSGRTCNTTRAIPPATYSVRWSMPVYWEKRTAAPILPSKKTPRR